MSCLCGVDPDQLASEEADWSGYALFAIKYVNLYQQSESSRTNWLKIGSGHGILIYSAWQGWRSCWDGQLTYWHFSWVGLVLYVVNQYFVHILLPVIDQYPSWISGSRRMTTETVLRAWLIVITRASVRSFQWRPKIFSWRERERKNIGTVWMKKSLNHSYDLIWTFAFYSYIIQYLNIL